MKKEKEVITSDESILMKIVAMETKLIKQIKKCVFKEAKKLSFDVKKLSDYKFMIANENFDSSIEILYKADLAAENIDFNINIYNTKEVPIDFIPDELKKLLDNISYELNTLTD